MDETLIDSDRLPLARKSVLPGTGFFTPDRDEGPSEERIAALERASVVVVTDGDADGLGCAALIREVHDDPLPAVTDPAEEFEPAEGHVALVPSAPHRLSGDLETVTEHTAAGVAVYVCDICPDRESDVEPVAGLADHASTVRWFDHHQWDEALAATVEAAGVDLVVGESDEECSTDVALRELDGVEGFAELAAVTRDHDLWIREDPRSDDLADFAHWVAPELYVATVREHGVDLPPAAAGYLTERREEKQALVHKAVERAELVDVDGITVGITYGRCSQNEVAEALRGQGADAAAVIKPAGSASIRGTESFERCHEVAGQLGGGGHPRAAGCKPDIYDDMLDYAHHWTTQGAVAKQVILDAFRALEPEDDAGTEKDGDEEDEGIDTDR